MNLKMLAGIDRNSIGLKMASEADKKAIDLTPAAAGSYVVPVINIEEHLDFEKTGENIKILMEASFYTLKRLQ